jgi:recombination protein RecA
MASNKNDVTEKQKALSMVLNQIERNFGKGSIMRLGDASSYAGGDHSYRSP